MAVPSIKEIVIQAPAYYTDIVVPASTISFLSEPLVISPGLFVSKLDVGISSDTIGCGIFKYVSDSVRMTDDYLGEANDDDDQVASLFKNSPDYLSTADDFTRQVVFTRNISDQAVTPDSLSVYVQTTPSDLTTPLDVAGITVSKDLLVSPTNAIIDIASTVVQFNRIIYNSVQATDDILGEANLDDDQIAFVGKTSIDTYVLSDTPLFTVNFTRAYSEVLTTLDTNTIALDLALLPDTYYASEEAVLAFDKSIIDTNNTVDIRILSVSKVAQDYFGSIDSYNLYVSTAYASSAATSDSIFNTAEFARSIIDSVQATDDILGEANLDDDQVAFVGKTTVDTARYTDSVNNTVDFTRAYSEALTTLDTNTVALDLALLPDTYYASEEALLAFDKSIIDTNNTIDTSTIALDLALLPDAYYASEEALLAFGKGIIDTNNTTDTSTVALELALLPDTYYASEEALLAFDKSIIDTNNTVDIRILSVNKASQDYFGSIDSYNLYVSTAYASSVTTGDSIFNTAEFVRSIIDSVQATDDILGEANLDDDQVAFVGKTTIDTYVLSDTPLFTVNFNRVYLSEAILEDTHSVLVNRVTLDTISGTEAHDFDISKSGLNSEAKASDNLDLVMQYPREFYSIAAYEDIVYNHFSKSVQDYVHTDDTDFAPLNVSIFSLPGDNNTIHEEAAYRLDKPYYDTTTNTGERLALTVSPGAFLEVLATEDAPPTFDNKITLYAALSTEDTLESIVDFNRVLVDFVQPNDDVLGEANLDDDQVVFVDKTTVDTARYTDSVNSTVNFTRAYSEVLTTLDTNTIALELALLPDTYYANEEALLAFDKSIIDTNNTVDIRILSVSKVAQDYFGSTDSYNLYVSTAYATSAITSDSIFNTAEFARSIIDSVQATDDILGEANLDDDQIAFFNKSLTAGYTSSEEFITTTEFSREINGQYTSTDTSILFITKNVLDSLYATDTFLTTSSILRTILDVASIPDTPLMGISKELLSSYASTDTLGISAYSSKEETVLTNETRTANIQNYFQPDYVEVGYVGTDLTL